MSKINTQRYRLQKFVCYDPIQKLEIWKDLSITSKNLESLQNFMVKGYRIFDSVTREIIDKTNQKNKSELIPELNFWL